jgi:hypothetical protein
MRSGHQKRHHGCCGYECEEDFPARWHFRILPFRGSALNLQLSTV